MDTKLTILFVLIAFIIALSHLGGSTGRVRRLLPIRRWRNLMPGWRRL
ncbi:MAG: hypothetical protein Q8M24_10320 [Pseudolabrys sp.]|nr:hypothetical protein [Pseudolabrys sp.]MDP2295842.1 hypothetical protein [Pseudolabrys sp.]